MCMRTNNLFGYVKMNCRKKGLGYGSVVIHKEDQYLLLKEPNYYEKEISYLWNLVPIWNKPDEMKM
jgi:hypothetical protein